MNRDTVAERHPAPPRRYLPDDFRAASWEDLAPHYAELEARALHDAEDLERWLLDRSELESWVSEESSRRHVAAAAHTDDAEIERAYLDYVTEVLPEVRRAGNRLDRKYLDCAARSALPPDVWQVYDRDAELDARLFREENVALHAQEEELCNEYGKITGAMTVQFRGRERTLPEMARFAEEPDRSVREEAWRTAAERRAEDAERLDDLFERMHGLRARIATNAGHRDYRDYQHAAYGRFDYTPADCAAFHDNVARAVMPIARRMQERRRAALEVDTLRPWDLAVDLSGAAAFRPFRDADGQVDVAARLLGCVRSEFAEELRWMHASGLLDLETRPHKRPGGFMDTFEGVRRPFIFANSGTTHGDVETLVHEGGHALHALRAREREPVEYRSAPLEFAEVASMGMEAMCMQHLGEVYPREQVRRARVQSLEGMMSTFPWTALVDAFQHAVYAEGLTERAARTARWEELHARFGGAVDWSGLERERALLWHRQLHVFEVPFYYVEYAIAQNGALQLWLRYREDPEAAVDAYDRGLRLGGSRPLPELFAAAGLRFDPRGELLGELLAEVERAWTADLAGEAA